MPQSSKEITGWDEKLTARISNRLCPEALRSVLMIVPAASGDVALATILIRYIKSINPGCRVSFATEKANIALIRLCPGVDDTIEIPQTPRASMSRRQCLERYAGDADAVVYTNWWPEDVDLLSEYRLNMLETVWFLAGVAGGMPPGPHRVWLETPPSTPQASDILRRALSRQARRRLAERGVQRLPESLAAAIKSRSLKGSRITLVARDIHSVMVNWAETFRPVHHKRLRGFALSRDFVILCTESKSIPPPSPAIVRALVEMLRQDGRTVLHNVLDPSHAGLGTVPLVCSYDEFVSLRQAGVPFVGWRSGLCDIAAASPAPMGVLYPPESDWCKDVRATFGFNAMGIDADCLEIVCRDVRDVKASGLATHLGTARVRKGATQTYD